MEKIFIAGGTGMLGSATARAFADSGIQVVVSTLFEDDPVGKTLEAESELIKCEVCNLLDLDQVESLFERHGFTGMVFAAQTHQSARTRDVSNMIYPILLNCLETARKHGVKRVVMGSSIIVYAGLTVPNIESAAFPAEVPTPKDGALLTRFEVSLKRALEIIALDYGQDFQMGGSVPPGTEKTEKHELEVVVLRAPMMFGPGYRALGSPLGTSVHVAAGNIPSLKGYLGYGGMPINKLWAGFASIPSNYVKTNADCIKTAMLAEELKHHIYNIDSGFPRSPRAQMQALLNVAPESAPKFGFAPGDLPEAGSETGFNGSLFMKDFDWTSGYTLETAFEDYLAWLRSNEF